MPSVIRTRWSGVKRITCGGHGYSAEGKAFYDTMFWLFGKGIKVDEWKDVWGEYWRKEESNYVTLRKKDKRLWVSFEESNGDDGCCDLFNDGNVDDDDDFGVEGNADGMGMEEV